VKHPSLLRQQIFYAANTFIEPRADQFPPETNYVRLLYHAVLCFFFCAEQHSFLQLFLTFAVKSYAILLPQQIKYLTNSFIAFTVYKFLLKTNYVSLLYDAALVLLLLC
jgi:hypothetical protein